MGLYVYGGLRFIQVSFHLPLTKQNTTTPPDAPGNMTLCYTDSHTCSSLIIPTHPDLSGELVLSLLME